MKIRLVTRCGCTREVETKSCVHYQIPFPDGSWRVFTWESDDPNGVRIFREAENNRVSRKGNLKRWERE